MGLVLEVTTPENLMVRARHDAETLAARDQRAVRAHKMLMNSHFRKTMDDVTTQENVVLNERFLALVSKKSKRKAKM
jgi:enoyl-CoA hydratase/carnithine racemase